MYRDDCDLMEFVPEAGAHVLQLANHQRLAASLGMAVGNMLTPCTPNGGLVTIPIMSALSVAFPGASCVRYSVMVLHCLPCGVSAHVRTSLAAVT